MADGHTPTVAIVGRPNVGKSTLFNRLVGERRAIVHNLPGVTRDRITGRAELAGTAVQLVDTGGLVPGDDPLGLNQQVLYAVEESDLLIFVVDGREGLVPADERVLEEFRPHGKPTVLAVNKGDTRVAAEGFGEFYRLGIEPLVLVSAEHGTGIGELADAVAAALPPPPPEVEVEAVARLAIVGRPNVGKSSLVNRLVGTDRVLVSDIPGTTRDPIDTPIERDGRTWLLIDTAGIRRRSRTSGAPEALAVMMARRQIERADLALLVVDAAAGVTTGDLAIAGAAWELGRSVLVLVNKWDLLVGERPRQRLEDSFERLDTIAARPRRVNVSAITGRSADRIFPAVEEVLASWRLEVGTSELNRLFAEAVGRHPAPAKSGRPWRVYYATQVTAGPPTFLLFANRKLPKSATYRRYLENFLRDRYDLRGTPVRLAIRRRSEPRGAG